MDHLAKKKKRLTQKEKRALARAEKKNEKRQLKSLHQLLKVHPEKKIPFKLALARYKSFKNKVKGNQKVNRRKPRGNKRKLSTKDARFYRLLVRYITSQTSRGSRRKYMKSASMPLRISGPQEDTTRRLIRIAYQNPSIRKDALELILDPNLGWEFKWATRSTKRTG